LNFYVTFINLQCGKVDNYLVYHNNPTTNQKILQTNKAMQNEQAFIPFVLFLQLVDAAK
jgi:hypothetical protein